jgi:hypothetical protein
VFYVVVLFLKWEMVATLLLQWVPRAQ